MKRVAIDELNVAGALDTDVTPDGVVFRRLPAWSRHQIMDIALGLLITMPAGVRLEFVTDATAIELDVMLTGLVMNDRPRKPMVFDLVVDGEVAASEESVTGNWILLDTFTDKVEFEMGEPTTIRFAPVAADGPVSVEVWLPHDCVVELRELRLSDGASVARPARRASALGPPRQLDQSLLGGAATDGDLARDRGAPRRCRSAERSRSRGSACSTKPLPARSVTCRPTSSASKPGSTS